MFFTDSGDIKFGPIGIIGFTHQDQLDSSVINQEYLVLEEIIAAQKRSILENLVHKVVESWFLTDSFRPCSMLQKSPAKNPKKV